MTENLKMLFGSHPLKKKKIYSTECGNVGVTINKIKRKRQTDLLHNQINRASNVNVNEVDTGSFTDDLSGFGHGIGK